MGAGFLGLYLAWLLYYSKPQLPKRIAQGLGSFYQTVLNKYYIDEIYSTLFVKPLLDGSTRILWHGVDQGVIDATVNNSADGAREVSDSVRHMQSGNLRSYAGWIAAGAAGRPAPRRGAVASARGPTTRRASQGPGLANALRRPGASPR